MNAIEMREQFLLDPKITFLNHGSFGACPNVVFEDYQKWQSILEREPVDFLLRKYKHHITKARQDIGKYLNCHEDDIVFVLNATQGVNIVAQSLKLQQGDEILSTNLEYGACDRVWEKVCRHTGAKYVRRGITLPVQNEEMLLEEIWSGVNDKTKVFFISHITSSTALTLPVEKLIKRCQEQGIISVIDGAHVPGQIDLNLEELDPDFYAGNCHKWMMAPKGCAVLYAKRDRQDLLEPLMVGWGNHSLPESRFIQELEYPGTNDPASYLAISKCIEFMKMHNWPARRKECHQLVLKYRSYMMEKTGIEAIAPDDNEKWFSQMCAHKLPPHINGQRLHSILFERHHIEIPITEVYGDWYMRISIQGYNSEEDVDRLFEVLDEELT